MKKFKINVNGTSYDVEVEEIGGAVMSPAPARTVAPAAAPAPVAAPAAATASAAAAPVADGAQVKSPMPGNILDVKVSVGDSVSEGDILMILEAMKMENEILAPVSGKVAGVQVAKGAAVNSGDVLVVIA
ncbi:MAG: biotin/lipoyl-binding protein [Eubacteriales bacterium]|nr:biotin/lipoyl-binding protein [Eubacteriales bacterium]